MTTNFNRHLDKLQAFMDSLNVELCEDMENVSIAYLIYMNYRHDGLARADAFSDAEAERLKSNVADLLVSIAQAREITDSIIQLLSERLFVEHPWLAPDDTEEMADDQSQINTVADRETALDNLIVLPKGDNIGWSDTDD